MKDMEYNKEPWYPGLATNRHLSGKNCQDDHNDEDTVQQEIAICQTAVDCSKE